MTDVIDQDLVEAVRAQFADLRSAEPEVIAKLLGTKTIAPWYKDYKDKRSLEKALPDDWAEAGIDGAIWQWAVGVKATRSGIRKTHAEKTKQLATEHKQKVDNADRQRDTSLSATDSPLMDLIEAGFEQLPLGAQARVSAAADDEQRKRILNASLLQYRQRRLAEMFPEGIGKFRPNEGAAGPSA
jgi:hypothetical protein